LIFGNPIELISGCIRHFIHLPGTEMFDADYSAIQARGICWLAGEDAMLKMWKTGKDIYKFMASEAYGISESHVTDDQRSFGKVLTLACGFQMGAEKFQATSEAWGVPCDVALAEKGVATYRRLHPNVVKYWYFLDNSARSAIQQPGITHGPFTVRTIAGIPYMLAKLPSGRSLAYPYPKIEPGEDKKGNPREQITYWGQDPYSTQWTRVKLYGGKLAENLVMGVEADIMAHGLITADKLGFESVAVIHDQALALKRGQQTIEGFVAALTSLPSWAKGFPVKSDGRVRPYYSK
jgi:DNA polymerase